VNTRPAPRNTIAETPAEAVARSTASAIPWMTASFSVFNFSGRFNVTMAMPSRSS
jgi:hypothetical protein